MLQGQLLFASLSANVEVWEWLKECHLLSFPFANNEVCLSFELMAENIPSTSVWLDTHVISGLSSKKKMKLINTSLGIVNFYFFLLPPTTHILVAK